MFKSTDMKWLSVGRQKEGTERRRIVIVYKSEGSFLDFLEFICASCTTEMPSKGAVAKIRGNKRIINDKLALFS